MAPVLTPLFRRALAAVTSSLVVPDASPTIDAGAVRDATQKLAARDTKYPDPSAGGLDPHDISNVGFFVLFALLGLAFVIGSIWFFFWARNGGFHFKETDWEDYKTAVLRRRGPNGTLLSGATESTDLGGGSVYKDVADDDGKTTITESTGLSGITAGASDIAAREKREEKRAQRRSEREKRKRDHKKHSIDDSQNEKQDHYRRRVNESGDVEDEEAEQMAQKELRSYRHEKAARVGGLNKQSEGSSWDGSNATTSHTGTESELLPNKQKTPTGTPTKERDTRSRGGIRKVYSTTDRGTDRETERIRAEAKRLRDEGRSHRRDFSFQRAEATDSLLEGSSAMSRSEVSGDSGTGSELGTKSYHHPRPEIARAQREREREERRARRGGYRRGRGDDEL